jgi:hypothetical protein
MAKIKNLPIIIKLFINEVSYIVAVLLERIEGVLNGMFDRLLNFFANFIYLVDTTVRDLGRNEIKLYFVDTDCNLHNDKEPIKVWVP